MTKAELEALNAELVELLTQLRDDIDDRLSELGAVDDDAEAVDDIDEDD